MDVTEILGALARKHSADGILQEYRRQSKEASLAIPLEQTRFLEYGRTSFTEKYTEKFSNEFIRDKVWKVCPGYIVCIYQDLFTEFISFRLDRDKGLVFEKVILPEDLVRETRDCPLIESVADKKTYIVQTFRKVPNLIELLYNRFGYDRCMSIV